MTNYCISDEAIVIIGYQQIFRCYNVDKSEERMYKYFFFFFGSTRIPTSGKDKDVNECDSQILFWYTT